MTAQKHARAMDFKTFQDLFQRCLLGEENDILAHIANSSKASRGELLDVYKNAYLLRLMEFLENDFAVVRTYLGEENFARAGRAYIAAHPSRTSNARWFGRHFPHFLATTSPYEGNPEIGELARFEQALATAFDAADAPCLRMDDLTTLAPEAWADLIFRPHPSVGRLDLQSNALDIWQALSQTPQSLPPAPQSLPSPARVVVFREGMQAVFRELSGEEGMMWDEMAKGAPFGELCAMVATYGGEENAAARAGSYLAAWIESGMLREANADTLSFPASR